MAVKVAVPTPTTIKLPELTETTWLLLELNIHAPVELEIGAIIFIGVSPRVAVIGASAPMVGIAP